MSTFIHIRILKASFFNNILILLYFRPLQLGAPALRKDGRLRHSDLSTGDDFHICAPPGGQLGWHCPSAPFAQRPSPPASLWRTCPVRSSPPPPYTSRITQGRCGVETCRRLGVLGTTTGSGESELAKLESKSNSSRCIAVQRWLNGFFNLSHVWSGCTAFNLLAYATDKLVLYIEILNKSVRLWLKVLWCGSRKNVKILGENIRVFVRNQHTSDPNDTCVTIEKVDFEM